MLFVTYMYVPSPKFLHEVREEIGEALALIFNKSMQSGDVPVGNLINVRPCGWVFVRSLCPWVATPRVGLTPLFPVFV